jgi:DNA repair protein RecO (recombination protein O)
MARLADQLGSFTAELVHPAAALAMQDALTNAMLSAACAVAAGALPEREPHPRVFNGLLRLIAGLPQGAPMLAELVHWETVLLADLGYGLDLARCAVTGETAGLAFISPKTGRAVTAAGAGEWSGRLLRLPAFLGGDDTAGDDQGAAAGGQNDSRPDDARDAVGDDPPGAAGGNSASPAERAADPVAGRSFDPGSPAETVHAPPTAADWRDGLALTGHFLARDAFGHHHRPLPAARQMLYDRVAALAAESEGTNGG